MNKRTMGRRGQRGPLRRHFAQAAATTSLLAASCSPGDNRPSVGSQTNWFRACESTDECGELECICGACTTPCASDADCSELSGASCVPPEDPGAVALCAGNVPPSSVCLPRCADVTCAPGSSCVEGICSPDTSSMAQVHIDPGTRFQTLVGFGGGIAFTEDAITAHPASAELFDLLFTEVGLDALRLRNRYENGNDAELAATSAIVQAVTERLGHPPVLLMSAGSPPASLKENGDRVCGSNFDSCTLARLSGGGFDYAAFAGHWRASVEAYSRAGIALDYLSIQNHPNWVPSAELPGEACRFLPEQGTMTVTVGGVDVDAEFPGYSDAFTAVRTAFAALPSAPRLIAPEGTGPTSVIEYLPPLDPAAFDALSFHLYGVDPDNVDLAALEAIRSLSGNGGHPALQSEIQADARDTAVLMHYSLTAAGASAYLQNDLVSLTEDIAPFALVQLAQDAFETQLAYDVFAHYARHTDPGWVRVDAASDDTELLISAWLAPDERALTIVLTNSGATELTAAVPAPAGFAGARSEVTRTVFDGLERSVSLGALPANGVVRLPPGSISTVSLASE